MTNVIEMPWNCFACKWIQWDNFELSVVHLVSSVHDVMLLLSPKSLVVTWIDYEECSDLAASTGKFQLL